MPKLRVVQGTDKGVVVELKGDSLEIGREAGFTIGDQSASRKHAEIFRIGELFFLRDLDSKNGTYLNEEQVKEQALQVGDKIRIGGTIIVFEDEFMSPGEASQPTPMPQVQYTDDFPKNTKTIEINFKKLGQGDSEPGTEGDSQKLQLLYRISKILGSTHSLKKIYEKVLKLAVDAVNADAGYIFEMDATGKTLVPVMVVEKNRDKTTQVSQSIIRRVMEHQKALLTSDAAMDPRFQAKNSIIMRKTSSVVCAPLVSLDEICGVVYFAASRMADPFTSDDLELISVLAIQLGMAVQTVQTHKKQGEMLMQTVKTLVTVKEQRFPDRAGHSERVVGISGAIGEQMEMGPESLSKLALAAWMHDVGYLANPESLDTARMTMDELKNMRRKGQQFAQKICKSMGLDQEVYEGIIFHSEHFDGSGFPEGRIGIDIPLFARVIAVAKGCDLMVSYGGENGQGIPVKDALQHLNAMAKLQFDPDVVKALQLAYRKGTLFAQNPPKKS